MRWPTRLILLPLLLLHLACIAEPGEDSIYDAWEIVHGVNDYDSSVIPHMTAGQKEAIGALNMFMSGAQ